MAETNLTKNRNGYGYKYTDLAQIHEYLEQNGMKYYQEIETNVCNGEDYIITYRFIDGKWEDKPKKGCRVVNATLNGKSNPAQEQGSALTYARRYSLLMAFGLATEDDDAQSLTKPKTQLISEKDAKRLQEIMENKGLNVQALLQKNYNLNNTTELNSEQYAKIMIAIKDIPNKIEGGNNNE